MPYLQLASTRFPLDKGETRVGSGDSADIRLPVQAEAGGIDLVITVLSDLSASVRRESRTASIAINGVTLGSQPSPLFHGDRLVVDGTALVFGDESQAGMTTKMAAIGVDDRPPVEKPVGRRGRTGGRMVSLIDGREYTARSDGLTIGRDAGCDVVISAADVSRRHARIDLKPEGYVIVDLSTNGVLVNGVRIEGSHPLARGDVIRVGPEEFRFYADAATEPEVPPPPPIILATPPSSPAPVHAPISDLEVLDPFAPESTTAPQMPSTSAATAASIPEARGAMREASAGIVTAPTPAVRRAEPRRAALATLEIANEGPSKGERFELTSPLTHIGRGAHNDVIVAEESVSDTHAKVQRRESGWFIVDMDSTNGTYVGGQRVTGEAPLSDGVPVRFGGVKMTFRTVQTTAAGAGETRVVVGYRSGTPRTQPAVPQDAADTTGGSPPATENGVPRILLGGILLLALIVVFLILRAL